jgi:hypothetical protein
MRNSYGILIIKYEGKRSYVRTWCGWKDNIVTDLINALPGNSSVNTVQHGTTEEAVFSVSAVTSHRGGW